MACFLAPWLVVDGIVGMPARFNTASTVGASRCFSKSGSLFLSQFNEASIVTFLLFGFIFSGRGTPVNLEKAWAVGLSILSNFGSFTLSHAMASFIAWIWGSVWIIPTGNGCPEILVNASTVGASKCWSKSGSLLRSQSIACFISFSFFPGANFLGSCTPVTLEKAIAVGLSTLLMLGSFFRSH